MIRGEQIAAARALLRWSRQDLSDMSGVSLRTIARFESGEGAISTQKLERIEDCLLTAGVTFMDGGVTLERLKRRPGMVLS